MYYDPIIFFTQFLYISISIKYSIYKLKERHGINLIGNTFRFIIFTIIAPISMIWDLYRYK